jgi:predicted sugar kinase
METLAETLLERVDTLIEAQKSHQPLLSTTATSVAIAELAARNEGLERAVREIALEVQRLSASHDG